MNASQLNKVNELLTVGIPRKDKDLRAHLGNVVYIEPCHIMMVRTTLTDSPEIEFHHFDGLKEKEIKAYPLRFVREHNKRTVIDRKFLSNILQAMDSDYVIIYADEDCPVGIIGMMNREMLIEGVIAPRICDEIPENPEGFYD